MAVFSYRYDAELVPDLLENIEPVVDGWVAFDDREAHQPFSSEPRRRRLLIERAAELGATWVLAMDPDERIERDAATRVRGLTAERRRIVWEFALREMFSASVYRVDGIWGSKMQGRLFPVFDGPLCSERLLHGAWCVAPAGYSTLPAGLNLYHLKMISLNRRLARRNLYENLDPDHLYQSAGYDYLLDEQGAVFEEIPQARDFFPAHRETGHENLHMADVTEMAQAPGITRLATGKPPEAIGSASRSDRMPSVSQLGQLRISIGEAVCRDCKLAVVVIGVGAPKSLFDAVASLVRQDAASEIIVVNSGGGDVSDVLGQHLPSVIVVELDHIINVGAARNIGIQVSGAPFVGFLAGDCVAAPGWVTERVLAHMEGERAVASVVENDKPFNPFAWAAHLMTYGHRMPGATESEANTFGASYDRSLFDRYGWFSETMAIGEDSEFHFRFRRSDPIWLHNSVRTIHCNPGGPLSFVKDQFRRGLRRRYLADFFRVKFDAAFIALSTVRRVTRAARLSLDHFRGSGQLSMIASWPLLPLGATFYCIGMIVSHAKAKAARRLSLTADKMRLLGRPEAAMGLLRRAIDLRPTTARYHLALGGLLRETGEYQASARELYASWDITRRSLPDLYGANGATRSAAAGYESSSAAINFQVVVFCDGSEVELAEFLKAVSVQQPLSSNTKVFVVDARKSRYDRGQKHRAYQGYSQLAKFVSSDELAGVLCADYTHRSEPNRTFVVVSSSSCVPPPDWLAMLRAHIKTYPEVELFQGSCRPQAKADAGLLERFSLDLGFFPAAADTGGVLYFAHAANWACSQSLLVAGGGMTQDQVNVLGVPALTECVLKAGASRVYAPDWQVRFRMDTTLTKLLRRFYQDGYYGAKHMVVTKDRELAARLFSVRGLHGVIGAAWRFAVGNSRPWRFANRFFLRGPAFLLLLLVGFARQLGWLAGLKQFGVNYAES